MGRNFELRTDHNGLKYLFEQQNLNAKQTRWLEFRCEFDFDIKHIKGKENKVTNVLNRKIHAMHATQIITFKLYLKNRILEVVISYEHYLQVKKGLH
jgi:hypothetical protein